MSNTNLKLCLLEVSLIFEYKGVTSSDVWKMGEVNPGQEQSLMNIVWSFLPETKYTNWLDKI